MTDRSTIAHNSLLAALLVRLAARSEDDRRMVESVFRDTHAELVKAGVTQPAERASLFDAAEVVRQMGVHGGFI